MQIIDHRTARLTLPDVLLDCLPRRLSDAVLSCGAPRMEELRLHSGRLCTVSCDDRNFSTGIVLCEEEIAEILDRMCGGSLYAFREPLRAGYLPLPGGIRVGVCGVAAEEDGKLLGMRPVLGLTIRIPHPHPVDVQPVLRLLRERIPSGVLIFAPPGVGKTTLLRALASEASPIPDGYRTVIADCREELFGTIGGEDRMLDYLVGYPRREAIEIAVRNLGAQLILCDEIGGEEDADAILSAANRGVPIVATAHAATAEELLRRPGIARLHRARVFGAYVGLARNGSGGFRYEIRRMEEVGSCRF